MVKRKMGYQCERCNTIYQDIEDAEDCEKEDGYCCDICSERFDTIEEVEKHEKTCVRTED